ncbi:hypothetical protein EVG20_g8943 [Dentipellis fragilis]|uniref:Uncharacterized protein n=1 Tax=Dentipellis fragilis TaxID=205917 RepID=A0A4Y9Y3N5_9AGAM|nr:hypothetical protein EVG20_g8943 [Dentipellis fragilis]
MSFDASTPSPLLRSPKPRLAAFDDGAASITRKFDAVLSSTTQHAANYEQQIKELEDKLSEDLSNCRAIEGLLRDAYNALKRNSRRADKEALREYVPHIDEQLAESMEVLSRLEKTLPAVQAQTVHIRATYDSGWGKGERAGARPGVAEHGLLRAVADDRVHGVEPSVGAVEARRAGALPRLLLAHGVGRLDHAARGVPRAPAAPGLGRAPHVVVPARLVFRPSPHT